MADIHHSLIIETPANDVFDAVTTPNGLDNWYTLSSQGVPESGSLYHFNFGPDHQWKAIVTRCVESQEIAMKFVRADADWMGTEIYFKLEEEQGIRTHLTFSHKGWAAPTSHFQRSSYCWAMYLRILKRFLEKGEVVPFGDRLAV